MTWVRWDELHAIAANVNRRSERISEFRCLLPLRHGEGNTRSDVRLVDPIDGLPKRQETVRSRRPLNRPMVGIILVLRRIDDKAGRRDSLFKHLQSRTEAQARTTWVNGLP